MPYLQLCTFYAKKKNKTKMACLCIGCNIKGRQLKMNKYALLRATELITYLVEHL